MSDGPKTWNQELQERQAEFYQWMGQCVSAWAFADDKLFEAFRNCIGPYEQCAIIYYRIQSLDTRMTLTDEIVRSVLPKKKSGDHDNPETVTWKAIKKAFTDLLRVRSQIAHQQVHVAILASEVDPSGNPTPQAHLAPAFELFANVHERFREIGSVFMDDYPKPALSLTDLQSHYGGVMTLTADIEDFTKAALPKPLEPHRQPVPRNRPENH